MTEAKFSRGVSKDQPQLLPSNSDELRIPTVEDRRVQHQQDEAHISLVAAAFIFLISDVLWILISLALLSDFRLASLVLLGVDLMAVALTRSLGLQARVVILTRGVVGVLAFGIETLVFGSVSAYFLGQMLVGSTALVLAVGRGGEGRNVLGASLAAIGLVLAMAIGLFQEQGRVRVLNDQFVAAMELAIAGRPDDSRDLVNELLAQNDDDAMVHLMAIDYFASDVVRDLDAALTVAMKAVDLADGDRQSEALFWVARLLAMQQDFVGSLGYVDQVIEKNKDVPMPFMFRAQVLLELGRTGEALEDYRRVEKLAPNTDLGQQARLQRLSLEGPTFSNVIQGDK